MSKLGLNNIQSRLNDKVIIASRQKEMVRIKEVKGWNKESDDDDYSIIREKMIQQGASIKDIDRYIDWLKLNAIHLKDDSFNGDITCFRSMIITWGEKNNNNDYLQSY